MELIYKCLFKINKEGIHHLFKKIEKRKKYEEVLDQIKHLLMTKQITAGQKLPNEIELSKSMKISRSSLREALQILSVLGIVERRSGEGTVIKQVQPENIKVIMSLVAVSRGLDIADLHEVRTILENSSVKLAAKRREKVDLEQMEKILIDMDKSYEMNDSEWASYLDFLFHKSIVTASKNNMLLTLFEIISDLLGEQIRITRDELNKSKDIIFKFKEEHWGIYRHIKNKDSLKAKEAMDLHLDYANVVRGFTTKSNFGRN